MDDALRRFLGLALLAGALLIASTSFAASGTAGASSPPDDCAARREALAAAKNALRDCAAGGGGCEAELKGVESATRQLGDCPAATNAAPIASTAAPEAPAGCDAAEESVRVARKALRDCAATGGNCDAQMKALETAVAHESACRDAQAKAGEGAGGPAAAPTPTARPSPIGAVVSLSDGTVVRGAISFEQGALRVDTENGTLRVPATALQRIEVGTAGSTALTTGPGAPGAGATPELASNPSTPAPATSAAPAAKRIELGGGFSFFAGHSNATLQGSTSTSDGQGLALAPFVGFFQTPNFEWTALLNVRRNASNYSDGTGRDETTVGLFLRGAYLARSNPHFWWGPTFSAGYSLDTRNYTQTNTPNTTYDEQGPGGTLGLVAKTAIGNSALTTIMVEYYVDAFDLTATQGSIHVTGSAGDSGLQTTIGFSALF